MGWSEKLYAAIEPTNPYLDDLVLIVSGRYLLGAMAFGAVAWKAIAIGAAAYAPTVMRIAQPVAVLGAVLPRCVSAVGRNH
jgi:hypothetical protein